MYLWGHLIAVHDAMLPLLGIGDRRHPELNAPFLTEADNPTIDLPSATDLARHWAEVNGALFAGFARFSPADWTARHTAMTDADFSAHSCRLSCRAIASVSSLRCFQLGSDV